MRTFSSRDTTTTAATTTTTITTTTTTNTTTTTTNNNNNNNNTTNNNGRYLCAITLAAVGFYVACRLLLSFPEEAPRACNSFFLCGLLGMAAALLTVYVA